MGLQREELGGLQRSAGQGCSARTRPRRGPWDRSGRLLPGRAQTLCCRKDSRGSRGVCASGKARLALAWRGFACLLPFAGIACSRLFNQVAIPCVAGRIEAQQGRRGSWSVVRKP